MVSGREWRLVTRPSGEADETHVELVVADVTRDAERNLLVRNIAMSVEPYMRGKMSERVSYTEPYALGEAMTGHAVGEVVESSVDAIPVGSTVLHEFGWREYAALSPDQVRVVVPGNLDPSVFLGALGQTGMTAWVGLRRIARLKEGESILVSSAAGAVGAVAGQIAKAMGCTVIGSVGSTDKADFIVGDLGFDGAVNYRDGVLRKSLSAALAQAGLDSLDVYFDNVGGEHLESAIRLMGVHGRIALCGAISAYNATEPVPGPRNLLLAIWQRLRLEGFLLGDHLTARDEFEGEMRDLLDSGVVKNVETVTGTGIEQAWNGFEKMLGGECVGKAVVRL